MVLAMVGDPLVERPLEGERPHDGERHLDRAVRLERAVGEEAVVADGDAERGHDPHDHDEGHVDPREPAAPGHGDGEGHRQQRQDDEVPDGDAHPQAVELHGLVDGTGRRWPGIAVMTRRRRAWLRFQVTVA